MTAEKKKTSLAASVLNFIGTAIIIIAIVLCLLLTVPRLFGINSYTVLSGSMEPAIPVGSLVWTKSIDPADAEPGDVILFYDGRSDIPVTHRVVENDAANGQIITKGDANAQNDISPVYYQNVLGKMVLHIPKLGTLLSPLGTMAGKIAMALIILAGLFLCEAARRIART